VTNLGYLLVGWGATIAVGAIYAASLIRRGRRLAARVPASRRRWMTAEES
jgi:hypothetical protein